MLVGVFFTFAPIGLLVQMIPERPGSVWSAVMGVLVAGSISTAWAWCFIARRFWLLALIVPAQIVVPPLLFVLLGKLGIPRWVGPEQAITQRVSLGIAIIVCIVVGYILIVRFARAQERAKERVHAELDIAATIHQGLVPPIDLERPGIRVVGRSEPSNRMGGDLIDVVDSDARTDIVLVDVSGHGVGAGVVMAMIKGAIRMRLRAGGGLEHLVADLNSVLSDTARDGMFATFACLRFEHAAGRPVCRYALAGHLPILHHRAATGEIFRRPNEHLPLGVWRDESFRAGEIDIAPGDTLLLFTDGLTEVMDTTGRQLGLEGFEHAFRSALPADPDRLCDALLAAANAQGPRADDQSLIAVRLTS